MRSQQLKRAAAILGFVLATFPAYAQFPIRFPTEPPARMVQDALDHPYGRAVLAEFARTVARSADAACLQAKALDSARLIERGRDLFRRYGTQSMEKIVGDVDVRNYERRFAERAGRSGAAELARLRDYADVKQYLKLERPIRLAKILDTIVENFERNVLIARINMRSFSGISTGNDELLRHNPTEAGEEAIEKFVGASKSRQLKRFLELAEIATEAVAESYNSEIARTWGPNTFYAGVENELAEICIIKR